MRMHILIRENKTDEITREFECEVVNPEDMENAILFYEPSECKENQYIDFYLSD